MNKLQIAMILWERWNPLYAVLDSAQIPALGERLQSLTKSVPSDSAIEESIIPVQNTLLFQGREAIELSEVAPVLIDLRCHRSLLENLVEDGWGRSWGIYFKSNAAFADIAAHLRQFIKVEIEGGQLVFFRYYDPRVSRSYLPTCTPAERREFFGEGPIVEEFIIESEKAWLALVFRPDGTSEQLSFKED